MLLTPHRNNNLYRYQLNDFDNLSQGTKGICVETITSTETFSKLEKVWCELCDRAPEHSFFQTYTWTWSWWKYIGEPTGYALRLITIREDGRLVLIWPIITRRQGFWIVGSWLGSETNQYCDVIIEAGVNRNTWLKTAWHAIKTDCTIDVFRLEGIRKDSAIRQFLNKKNGNLKSVASSVYINIHEFPDWQKFSIGLKRKFWKDLLRTRRRLNEKGQLVHKILNDPSEIKKAISKSIKFKLEWLRARNNYGRLLEKPEAEQWLINTALAAHYNNTLIMTTLNLNDAIIACQIGFLYHRSFYCFLGAYDLNYSAFQPGKIETSDTLKWAFENNVDTYDLMPPLENYKKYWVQHEDSIETFTSYATSWGRMSKIWYNIGLRDKAIGIYHHLPRKLRKFSAQLLSN